MAHQPHVALEQPSLSFDPPSPPRNHAAHRQAPGMNAIPFAVMDPPDAEQPPQPPPAATGSNYRRRQPPAPLALAKHVPSSPQPSPALPATADYPRSRSLSTFAAPSSHWDAHQQHSAPPLPVPPVPHTPSPDPTAQYADYDRDGQVGIGELATPRWVAQARANAGAGAGAVERAERRRSAGIARVNGAAREEGRRAQQQSQASPTAARMPRHGQGHAERRAHPDWDQFELPSPSLSVEAESDDELSNLTPMSQSRTSQAPQPHISRSTSYNTPRAHAEPPASGESDAADRSLRKPRSFNVTPRLNLDNESTPSSPRHSSRTHTRPSPSADGSIRSTTSTRDFAHLPPSPSAQSTQRFYQNAPSAGLPPSDFAPLPPPPAPLSGRPPPTPPDTAYGVSPRSSTGPPPRSADGRPDSRRASTQSRPRSSSSRPGTPPPKSFLSEEKRSRSRASMRATAASGMSPQVDSGPATFASTAPETSPASASHPRLPFAANPSTAAKRGSTSSVAPGTPTSTSRDSTSASASVSSAGRLSSFRSRRNSASSDISSVQSIDSHHLAQQHDVPPVPRIPKDWESEATASPRASEDVLARAAAAAAAAAATSSPPQSAGFSPTTADGWTRIDPVAARRKDSSQSLASASTAHLSVDNGPSSTVSSKRSSTAKRLTPSSIPFFRRSSSQSMNLGPSASSSSYPHHAPVENVPSHHGHGQSSSTSASGTSPQPPAARKSMLGLGLPSLLKSSSSRRSLAAAAKASPSDASFKEPDLPAPKSHESRRNSLGAALMGRKRGKTIGSADVASKERERERHVPLPPIQMSALPPSTAQRVDRLKETPSSSSSTSAAASSIPETPASARTPRASLPASVSSKRVHAPAAALPTISASPAAVSNPLDARGGGEQPPKVITPTKIPRIRASAATSPQPRVPSATGSTSTLGGGGGTAGGHHRSATSSRRTSLILEQKDGVAATPAKAPDLLRESSAKRRTTGAADESFAQPLELRASRREGSVTSVSRIPKSSSTSFAMPSASSSRASTSASSSMDKPPPLTARVDPSALPPPKTPRDASKFSSVSTTAATPSTTAGPSAFSPRSARATVASSVRAAGNRLSHSSTSFSLRGHGHGERHGTPSSTPSPSPSPMMDEEALADEEMLAYVRRYQARKLAAGMKQEELDMLMAFPEPVEPTLRMSPREAMERYGKKMSPYEHSEILDFRDVYYVGQESEKKKQATRDNSHNNFGYDDDRGDYLVARNDHLGYRYEIFDTLGKGSFGQVLQCVDHKTGNWVAIKIIRNKKRFHHQALVEVKILDKLVEWDPDNTHNVIMKTEHFYFRNHLCIATELLSINLYELIKQNSFAGFSTVLIRRFASQLLASLALMRQHRIIHCDLKPENVLLRHPCKSGIKVIDFGSSCFEHEKVYTYIQSRFYRSPEVILGMNYSSAIDMWSFGAILVEIYTGYPLFPGENEQEQLACLMEILGPPDRYLIERSSRKKLFFDSTGVPRPVVNSKGKRRRPGSKTLAQVLKTDDELFIDFISRCLHWDPERRLKPAAALRHPFMLASPQRRAAVAPKVPTSSRTSRHPQETPRKPVIGAPTPLGLHHSVKTSTIPSSQTLAASTSTPRLFKTRQHNSLSSRTMIGTSSSGSRLNN